MRRSSVRRPGRISNQEDMNVSADQKDKRGMFREDGVSEMVGAVLLIAVISLGISIFAVAYFSQPVSEVNPSVTFNVSFGADQDGKIEKVYIRHLGGESIPRELIQIYIDNGGTVENAMDSLEIDGANDWDEWNIGNTLVFTMDPPIEMFPEVAMTYANSGGGQYISYISEGWTEAIPTDAPEVLPIADFTVDPTRGSAPLIVQYMDASTGGSLTRSWNFGDGGTSTHKNPSHTYTVPGTYTVSLTVSNSLGTSTKTESILVTVPDAPIADFTGTPISGSASLTVQFTDTSTNAPTAWFWDFENDGTIDSAEKNPVHTYASEGAYTVTLTATNAGGSSTETKAGYITVTDTSLIPPVADFTGTPASGIAPLTVQFTDSSTNNPTAWAWDFGDGSISILQSPTHTYVTADTYIVSLIAENEAGSHSISKANYISVTSPAPTVTGITPNTGESGSTISITSLAGTHFQTGANVKLSKSGESDITASSVTFVDVSHITCAFDLTGAVDGSWNVVVTNPDGQYGMFSGGFTVTMPPIYDPEPDLKDELDHWITTGDVGVVNDPVQGEVIQLTNGGTISRTLSTIGYSNIQISFSLAAINLKQKGDAVVVEWFDGTSWHELLQIKNDDPEEDGNFHNFSYTLPSSADNNPNFNIRFRIEHQGSPESSLVDLKNLQITGDSI